MSNDLLLSMLRWLCPAKENQAVALAIHQQEKMAKVAKEKLVRGLEKP